MTHNTYTIKKNNNINKNTFFNDIFSSLKFNGTIDDTYEPTDYSKALDDLILSSIASKNPGTAELYTEPKKTKLTFLFGKKSAKKATKINTLLDAIYYLAHNYTPETAPYSTDYIKIKLTDGTILRIFDDEIQINDTLLSLEDSAALMKYITPKKQKMIIDFAIKIAA